MLVGFALAACGEPLGTDAVTTTQARGYCGDICAWGAACFPDVDVGTCTAECIDEIAGWAREDAIAAYFGCFTGLACGEDGATCAQTFDPLPVHLAYETSCRRALGACVAGDDLDARCDAYGDGFIRWVAPPIVERILTCFDEPGCGDALSCVEAYLETYGVLE